MSDNILRQKETC